jgi:hypothetical protein
MARVELSEAEFRALVSGKVLKCTLSGLEFELVVSNIGWRTMLDAVIMASRGSPPDPPQAREFLSTTRGRNNRK